MSCFGQAPKILLFQMNSESVYDSDFWEHNGDYVFESHNRD